MEFDGVDIENLNVEEIIEIYDDIIEQGDIIGGGVSADCYYDYWTRRETCK